MSVEATATGLFAPARMQQIREAARDSSPFIPIAKAMGITGKADLACAPEAGQWMGLSLLDLSTHMMVFGATGTGKTSSILRPTALRIKLLEAMGVKIGALLSDGKGAMVADMRSLLDTVIEPGTKFAPFQGMSAAVVAEAFAQANGSSMSDKDSIWVKGAGTFHLFCLTVLEALVSHEKANKADGELRLGSLEHQVEHILADMEIARRAGRDLAHFQNMLNQKKQSIKETQAFIMSTRQYRWTPTGYNRLKDILSLPVMMAGGVMRANDDAMDIFQFLGYKPSDDQIASRPVSVHPDLRAPGRVLSRAIEYFVVKWPNIHDEARSSYLMNVDEDILGFLKSDLLRGSMIKDEDHGDEAWADTEEGVDVLGVLYGDWLGINLPATQYGHTAKVIAKLIKSKVFNAIRERGQKYGDRWREATGQVSVMDMVDECQDMVSPMEIDLTAVARSLGLFFIYATQTYESLDSVMKSKEAKNRFLNNFLSIAAFRASEETYQYVQSRAGKVKKLRVPTQPQAFMDISRAIDTFDNTIYADPNHPSAHILRDLDRRGSTRLQVVVEGMQPYRGLSKRIPLEEMRDQNYLPVYMGGKYEVTQMLEDWEINDSLSVRGSVILLLNRAGHARIDFAKTQYHSVQDVEDALAVHRAKSQQAA
ncbi:TraM recognition domain-containing protein [Stenotrophomonas maltophilia]|mgnify:CR=1 FL=1|jgi:hypothetical protein|nr:TraM recognition domain-containing protein [Stenotrophomonas maltophilia]